MILNNYTARKFHDIERKCGYCGTTNTSIGTKKRGEKVWKYPNWSRWNGIMACSKCYKTRYDAAKPKKRKRQKLDGIERKCVLCNSTTTRIAGTKRCKPYERWYCYNDGAICYRCKIRLLSRARARREGIKEREFHENRPLVQIIRKCLKYLLWREAVLKRDNYSCRDCGLKTKFLQAHHIKPFLNILKENNIDTFEKAMDCSPLWEIENGMTLCRLCHEKKDPRKIL